MPRQWELQEAKARFSDRVEQALTGEAQVVTRRGHPAIVVVSYEEYEMQVTCLSGDAWHEDGRLIGSFTIRVLLEVGHAPNGTQVYGGFEGTVDVQAIADFTGSLTNLVAYYERIE